MHMHVYKKTNVCELDKTVMEGMKILKVTKMRKIKKTMKFETQERLLAQLA